jgi:hypothetical protein
MDLFEGDITFLTHNTPPAPMLVWRMWLRTRFV